MGVLFFAGSAAFLELGFLVLRLLGSCCAAAAFVVAIRLDYIIRRTATTVSRTLLFSETRCAPSSLSWILRRAQGG